jgi:hypothetical protein
MTLTAQRMKKLGNGHADVHVRMHTHTEQGDLISLHLFFQNKESGLTADYNLSAYLLSFLQNFSKDQEFQIKRIYFTIGKDLNRDVHIQV